MDKKSPIHLIHHKLTALGVAHLFDEDVEDMGIFVGNEYFKTDITSIDGIITVDRINTITNEVDTFKIPLADPEFFKKLRSILCP